MKKNVLHLSCRIISLFIAVFMMAMVILSTCITAYAQIPENISDLFSYDDVQPGPCIIEDNGVNSIKDNYIEFQKEGSEDYRAWSQSDSRWGYKILGYNGTDTCSQSGCLVSSVAKLIIQCGLRSSESFNIGTFIDSLNAVGGFDSNSCLYYGPISTAVNGFSYYDTFNHQGYESGNSYSSANYNDMLIGWVRDGYHLALRVGNHYVAVDEALTLSTGQVYIMDSAFANLHALADIRLVDTYSVFYDVVRFRGGTTPSGSSSSITISGQSTPIAIWEGDMVSIKGNVTSRTTMSNITVGCYDVNGNMITGASANPRGNTYSVNDLDLYVRFDQLPAGMYIYRITATNTDETVTVYEIGFSVWTKNQSIPNGEYIIESSLSDYYAVGCSDNNVVLRRAKHNTPQIWLFEYAGDGFYTIKNKESGLYLEAYDCGSASGTNIQTYTKNGSTAQLWQVLKAGNAYCFAPKCSLYAIMDIENSKTEDGVNISLFTPHLQGNQRFFIKSTNDMHAVYSMESSPDCTTGGAIIYECRICGVETSKVLLPKLGHDFSSSRVITEPTCTEDGLKQYVCSRCSTISTEAIPKLGHDFSAEFTVDVPATCTTTGIKSQHCLHSGCTAVQNETVIEKTEHNWDSGIIIKKPSSYQSGKKIVFCQDCGAEKNIEISSVNESELADYAELNIGNGIEVYPYNEYNDNAVTDILLSTDNIYRSGKRLVIRIKKDYMSEDEYICINGNKVENAVSTDEYYVLWGYTVDINNGKFDISISAPITITSQPESKRANVGDIVSFEIKAAGTDLAYQWQYSIDGGKTWKNSATKTATYRLQVQKAYDGYMYRCVVTDKSGKTVASNAASLTINASLAITSQPESKSANVGDIVSFEIKAAGTDLAYQWQYSIDGGKTWKNSATKTATYRLQVQKAYDGYMYRCVVTDKSGKTVASNAASLTINASLAITSQPESKSANVGDIVSFEIKATGTDLAYQWQYSTDKGATWKNSAAKTATYRVQVQKAYDGYMYRCIVTDKSGKSLTSAAATLTVNASLAITSQPESKSANVGDIVSFEIKATGTDLAYQWQYSTDKGATWKNSAAKTATYRVQAQKAYDGYMYRCVVTDKSGKSLTSAAASLTVNSEFTITSQPVNKTANAGEIVTFEVKATGTGLTYQWQYSTDNGVTWKNSAAKSETYRALVQEAYDGYMYRCVVTDKNGETVTSNAAMLTVV